MKFNLRSKVILPIIVVVVGAVGASVLARARVRVEPRPASETTPLVRAQIVEPQDVSLDVWTQGTVQPRTQTSLVSEVDGRILWVSPALVTGGFFEENEALVRIDPTDYELAVARTAASVESSASRLALAKKTLDRNQTLAKSGAASTLELDDAENATRVAESMHREAEAAFQQARRNLDRTEVRAPFAGRVRSENVDVGQFVGRGTAIAKLYAVDFAEVKLPLADADLAFLELDLADRNLGNSGLGPAVDLRANFAGKDRMWRGHITRTEGEIDPRSRMINVIARVEDPYGSAAADVGAPLAVGLYVDAEIEGRVLRDAVVLPRGALRGPEVVLVVDENDQLRERRVKIARKLRDQVVVANGLEAGDRVLLSNLEKVTEGMQVRVAQDAG